MTAVHSASLLPPIDILMQDKIKLVLIFCRVGSVVLLDNSG